MRSYLNRSFYIKKEVKEEEKSTYRQKSLHTKLTALPTPPLIKKPQIIQDIKQEPKFMLSRVSNSRFSKTRYLRNERVETTIQTMDEDLRLEKKNDSQTIESFLSSQGFDFVSHISKNSYLPLEKFEDDSLQVLSDDQVIKMLKTQKIQIEVMEQSSLGDWFWYKAELVSYTKMFHYKRKNKEGRCCRIHFIMDFEDKFLYLKKLQQAFFLRDQMDRYLKFNCYVENMPTDDLVQITNSQIKRVQKRIGFEFNSQLINQQINEVNMLYLNTQNQIIFLRFLKCCETNQKFKDLLNIFKSQYIPQVKHLKNLIKVQNIYSEGVLIQQIETSFSILKQSYVLASISMIKQVQKCLQYISNKINELLQLDVFIYSQQPFEKFKFQQEVSIKNILSSIKLKWIRDIIDNCSQNLQIQNKKSSLLNQIQLDRFFQMIRMKLQDALQNFINKNIDKFLQYLLKHIPEDVQILSYSQVHNVYNHYLTITKPLFTIQIFRRLNEIVFSANPIQFQDMIMGLEQQIYDQLGDIPDPETCLVEYYSKDFLYEMNGNLKAPQKNIEFEENIEVLAERIKRSLFEYLKQFEHFMKLEIQKPFEIQKAETLILDNREDIKQIEQIPYFIEVCGFLVIMGDMKQEFLQILKRREQFYIEQLALFQKDDCIRLLTDYANLELKILEKPQNIEFLVEKREFLEDVLPVKLNNLQQLVQQNKNYFNLLNSIIDCQSIVHINFYPIRREDTHKYYRLLFQEIYILRLAENQKIQLEKQKEEIFQAQAIEQQKFKKKIKYLQQQIFSFQQYSKQNDNEKALQIMKLIEKLLSEYQEEAQKFNKREQLFGLPQTNYENILQLQNEFKPFYSIWKVNQIWQDQYTKWLNDPLSQVNCTSLEQFFNVEFKQFIQVYENIQSFEIVQLWENIKREIDQFQIYVPILLALTKNNLRERHFQYLSNLLNIKDSYINSETSLNCLIKNNIINFSEESIDLGLQAQEEYGIEQILKQISETWASQKISSIQVKGIQVIKKIDQIQNLVDDHLISLEVVMRQKNNAFFLNEIENLYDKLKQVSLFLEEWSQAQNQIVYLQPIFDSNDILKQLPVEFKKYRQVDKMYKEIIGFSEKVIDFGMQDISKVQQINNLLDQIQKELGNYLERKKEKFSRFYFVSNEEILEILSNGQDLSFLQKYLFKLFEGIISLKMNKQYQIYALQTKDCELRLGQKIDINCKNIEEWLVELEQSMKDSIKDAILYNNSDCGNQIAMINFDVDYTSKVEEYLQNGRDLRIYLIELKEQLSNKNLDISTIILLAHHIEVIQRLVDYEQQLIPFYWSLQMRYYIQNCQCVIKSLEANIQYGYEFLGNIDRIIITPLTERSLIIFLNAIHYKRGGAAVGQTGTGKTETIKDLCRAVGQRCIQFNCSELVDYVIIAQFIKGLSLSGCWSCFDEFNRITTEVLSVAASNFIQYQPIGIFVTMNPNYKGRNQLPDNLKSYFRMASMIAPNISIIISTLLYVHGFSEPQQLTQKLIEIFSIAKDLLTDQPHYDYSLRAIKSVIIFAGQLKNESNHKDYAEQNYILKALKYVFEPKLLSQDWLIFHQLVEQFFPLLEIRSVERDNFGNFIATSTLQQKVTELKQIFKFRHGIMILGPAGQGKSTCLEIVLKQSNLESVRIFPKSMKVSELFGCLNISTLEWEEGVLPNILKQEQHNYQVLIFDGQIETDWIETLNSALDDSKRLCLTNGCIININQTMVFEADDLKGATPSTISRCGILYIQDDPLLGLKQFISQTCQNLASKFNDIVEKLKSRILEHSIPLTFFSQQMINIMKVIENEFHQLNLQLFIYCLAWSILPFIEEKTKKQIFNQFLQNLGNIFCDNLIIHNEYNQETHRFQLIHVPTVLKLTCFEDIYVPRIEDMSYKKMSLSLLNVSSVRFEGISGAGKTKLINEILHSFHHIRINCSSQTTSSLIQQTLEINLEKRRKGVFGPQMGTKCLIILDDFHMPQDVEVMRQFLHQKGWFPKRDPHTILQKIEDTNLLVAMNNFHNHNDRLLRLWTTFKFTNDEQNYQTIFTQITTPFQMQQVVGKTLQAFKQIKEQIKATPQKIHYQFTMRDVWRVLQSLCNKKTANEQQWNFEMARVFIDRLITKQDKILAQSIIGIESVQFAEFTSGYNDHSYKPVQHFENLLQLLRDQFQKFGIPIYNEALKSLIAITRVLGLYQGHMVILGQVGTGGVQLAKLAALIQENDCPNVDRWKDDLKNIIKKCIFENKKTTIIVDECKNSHNQPQIYQDVSTLLNCGDLDIFNRQELDDMLKVFEQQITSNQANSGKNFKILLHQKFVNRIQTNLHCIISINSTQKFRHYPNLINCATILALQQLSEQALISIAQVNLKGSSELSQKQLCELLKFIHQSALSIDNYQKIQNISSIHYQEFIAAFNRIYEEKSLELEQRICRIRKGLQKILTANETIGELKNELLEITPEIEKAQQESSVMMEKLRKEKDQAFQQESLLSEDETQANIQQVQATKLADEAVQAVQEVNLLLEETLQDVSKLKKEHLIEIKSLGKPPKPVIIILTGVVILNLDNLRPLITQSLNSLTIQDYFEIAKKYLLNDPKELLELIRSYDKNNINPYNINKLEKIVLTEPDFTFDRARQCSAAVKYLYSWVKAMYEYNKVYIETKPLREKLFEAQKQLKEKTTILNEKKNQLSVVLKKVKILQEQFNIQTEKCDQLNKQLEQSTIRLQRAINLTKGLEEEQSRWTQQISALEKSKKCILGDCIMASAYLSYCSSLSEQLRHQILSIWKTQIKQRIEIQHEPWEFLSNSIIPNHQQNNQIFLEYANKPILCIDPQCLANQFIRTNYQVMIVNDQHQFEQACSLKLNILFENINAEQKKVNQHSSDVLQGNEFQNTIPDWLTDFISNTQTFKTKIFITTMQYNFLLSSLNYSQFYVINFQITQNNAQELMLNHIVNSQNPQLYKQQVEIKQMQVNNEQRLKQIEDTILSILNVDNIRDLLNEETLINQLSNSKKIFNEIKQAQQDYSSIQNDLAHAKLQYQDLSKQIADLYFISQDVQTLDYMYQFSLEWFTNQLTQTIQNVRNLKQIFSSFRLRFYTCLSRVLSENHRLVLAFLLAKQTIEQIDKDDWLAFIGYSNLKVDDSQVQPNQYIWINQANYNKIQAELNAYSMISAKILKNNFDEIRDFYLSKTFKEENIPHYERLDELQKMFIVKAIRPDYLIVCIKHFLQKVLDFDIDSLQQTPLEVSFNESEQNKVLLYVLQNNQDPMEQIKEFSVIKNFNKKMWTISLGQGQGQKAEKMIKEAAEQGLWIVIQNCHLHQQWLNELDKLIMIESHQDYRLWLTSKSISSFPGRILQKSVKLTYENKDYQKQEMNEIVKFHFGLLNFCQLGLLGFNKKYEFTQHDLIITQEQSKNIELNEKFKNIALRYIVSELHYGGHIIDQQDQIVLNRLSCYYLIDNTVPINNNLAQVYLGEQQSQNFLNQLLFKEFGQVDEQNLEVSKAIQYLQSNLPQQILFDNKKNGKLDNYIQQEFQLFNQLLQKVESSIQLIQRILSGEQISNISIIEDIKYQRVPQLWIDYGFKTDKNLPQWFSELVKRGNFLSDWNEKGIPPAIWLGGLMKPNSFLMHAKCGEDSLNKKTIFTILDSIILEHITSSPEIGYYIYGIVLQGAKWNGKQHILMESEQMLNEFPICYLNYKVEDEYQLYYNCPLYRLIDRQERITFIPMSCDTIKDWLISGVAAFININI